MCTQERKQLTKHVKEQQAASDANYARLVEENKRHEAETARMQEEHWGRVKAHTAEADARAERRHAEQAAQHAEYCARDQLHRLYTTVLSDRDDPEQAFERAVKLQARFDVLTNQAKP